MLTAIFSSLSGTTGSIWVPEHGFAEFTENWVLDAIACAEFNSFSRFNE